MYRKHKKHKKTIIDFYSSNDEIERLKILKEISEEKMKMLNQSQNVLMCVVLMLIISRRY